MLHISRDCIPDCRKHNQSWLHFASSPRGRWLSARGHAISFSNVFWIQSFSGRSIQFGFLRRFRFYFSCFFALLVSSARSEVRENTTVCCAWKQLLVLAPCWTSVSCHLKISCQQEFCAPAPPLIHRVTSKVSPCHPCSWAHAFRVTQASISGPSLFCKSALRSLDEKCFIKLLFSGEQ